jgi:hypothetical protein
MNVPELGDDAAENAGLIALALKARGEDGLPLDVVERSLKGENTLKLIREWRGLTQKGLAEKARLQSCMFRSWKPVIAESAPQPQKSLQQHWTSASTCCWSPLRN